VIGMLVAGTANTVITKCTFASLVSTLFLLWARHFYEQQEG
jgi:hypothetical protein